MNVKLKLNKTEEEVAPPKNVLHFFAIFSRMRLSISTLPIIFSFIQFCVARTLLVDFHLDNVLEVLLVVGLKFSFTKLVK